MINEFKNNNNLKTVASFKTPTGVQINYGESGLFSEGYFMRSDGTHLLLVNKFRDFSGYFELDKPSLEFNLSSDESCEVLKVKLLCSGGDKRKFINLTLDGAWNNNPTFTLKRVKEWREILDSLEYYLKKGQNCD